MGPITSVTSCRGEQAALECDLTAAIGRPAGPTDVVTSARSEGPRRGFLGWAGLLRCVVPAGLVDVGELPLVEARIEHEEGRLDELCHVWRHEAQPGRARIPTLAGLCAYAHAISAWPVGTARGFTLPGPAERELRDTMKICVTAGLGSVLLALLRPRPRSYSPDYCVLQNNRSKDSRKTHES